MKIKLMVQKIVAFFVGSLSTIGLFFVVHTVFAAPSQQAPNGNPTFPLQGTPGPQGPAGAQGATGPQGPAGPSQITSYSIGPVYRQMREDLGKTVYITNKSLLGYTINVNLDGPCSDDDGCDVTLTMRNFEGSGAPNYRPGIGATRGPYRLYLAGFTWPYNPAYGRYTQWWRFANSDAESISGDGTVVHLISAWSCYLTDGYYFNRAASDTSIDYGLLMWDGYDANTECVLTVED